MSSNKSFRIEKDSMGEFNVPHDAYYGAQTMRAVENFPISTLRFPRNFIKAIALIKGAAAKVNCELGLINEEIASSIISAAQEVSDGKFDGQFVVDIFQTGSGTSTNMNANEVISNRAIEILGGTIGSKIPVHPNDHVNMGQSSNDVIPTAIHVSALLGIKTQLIPSLEILRNELSKKSIEFMSVVKTGRTHLQDETPITLGQTFEGFVGQINKSIERINQSSLGISEVALGGTAVGTGVNTHLDFASKVCGVMSDSLSINIKETDNHFQAQSTLDALVECSGSLKTLAVSLMKIANDIRWLGSGPRAGIGEIELPAVQPGSSIMPGKVNPVIPESVCQVAAQVIGNDQTIVIAGQSGNFEINVMMPIAGYNLLESIDILSSVSGNFASQCISGITSTSKGPDMVKNGLAIATTLVPHIGYDAAALIAKEAQQTGKTIMEVAMLKTDIPEADLNQILDPISMTVRGNTSGPSSG